MTQGNSDGVRRCDGKCHKAKSKVCSCICCGRYHGKGSSDAAQEALTKDWLGEHWRDLKEIVERSGGSFEVAIANTLTRGRIQ